MITGKRLLAGAVLACCLGTAHASTPSMEDAFWACDYIATTRGTASAPTETCMAVYEQFKAAKFGGDFEALVAWWQANKEDAHARTAELVAAAPVAPVTNPPAEAVQEKPSRVARLMAVTRSYLGQLASVFRDD